MTVNTTIQITVSVRDTVSEPDYGKLDNVHTAVLLLILYYIETVSPLYYIFHIYME